MDSRRSSSKKRHASTDITPGRNLTAVNIDTPTRSTASLLSQYVVQPSTQQLQKESQQRRLARVAQDAALFGTIDQAAFWPKDVTPPILDQDIESDNDAYDEGGVDLPSQRPHVSPLTSPLPSPSTQQPTQTLQTSTQRSRSPTVPPSAQQHTVLEEEEETLEPELARLRWGVEIKLDGRTAGNFVGNSKKGPLHLFWRDLQEESLAVAKRFRAEESKPVVELTFKKIEVTQRPWKAGMSTMRYTWHNSREFYKTHRDLDEESLIAGNKKTIELMMQAYYISPMAPPPPPSAPLPPSTPAQQTSSSLHIPLARSGGNRTPSGGPIRRGTATEQQLEQLSATNTDRIEASRGNYLVKLMKEHHCSLKTCSSNKHGKHCWVVSGTHYLITDSQLKSWATNLTKNIGTITEPSGRLTAELIQAGPTRSTRESSAAYNSRIHEQRGQSSSLSTTASNGPLPINVQIFNGPGGQEQQQQRQPPSSDILDTPSSPPEPAGDDDDRVIAFFHWKAAAATTLHKQEVLKNLGLKFVDEFFDLHGVKYYKRNHPNNSLEVPIGLLATLEGDVRRWEATHPKRVPSPAKSTSSRASEDDTT